LLGNSFYDKLFDKDAIYAQKSLDQFLFKREEAHGSLFLSILNDLNTLIRLNLRTERLRRVHPDGLPRLANTDIYFLFDQVIDGVISMLADLPKPFFSYFHLIPPHAPYTPSSQFIGAFDDGWSPPARKRHPLAPRVSEQKLNALRRNYDEYILNVDAEFGRLLDFMESSGLLENSYIILTSDHGELFERGVHGHSTPVLFEPVIRVPLVISAPGQRERKDIFALTSNVDLLPTFTDIAGLPVPSWCEGRVLPGLGGDEDSQRSVFVVEAKRNPAHAPLRKASIAMLQGQYKLVYYTGYKYYDEQYELYDLNNDPQELENQYPAHPAARELQSELEQRLREVSQ
jgi:choline-sulfatase